MKFGLETITPKKAENLLATQRRNRSMCRNAVAEYARRMRAGDWHGETGETIKIDADGHLVDGQHRLAAVVAADLPQDFLVVRGVPPEAQDFIDCGKPRTAAQLLGMRGVPDYNTCAGIGRLLHRYRVGGMAALVARMRPSNHEIVETVLSNLDHCTESARFGRRKGFRDVFTPTQGGFLHLALSEIEQGEAEHFLLSVATGANLGLHSPALTLRNRLVRLRADQAAVPSTAYILVLAVKAWNAERAGKELRLLRWNRSESVPEPR